MSRSLVAALLLASATSAFADSFIGLAINPPSLDSHSALTAVVSGTAGSSCVPIRGTASFEGSTITLTIIPPPEGICLAVVTSWKVPVFIGTLPPGNYDVVVMFRGAFFARRSISIADADPPIRIVENVGLASPFSNVTTIYPPIDNVLVIAQAAVTFDDVPATVITAAHDHLVVSPPKHAAGAATVKLIIPNGPTYTAINGYRYVDLEGPADRAAYEAILIPLVFSGPGALGSLWTTDLWVHNASRDRITQLNGPFTFSVCIVGPCLQSIDPETTAKLIYPPAFSLYPHGRVMYVPRVAGAALNFGLRVRDLNQQRNAHGTEIPVVRERDLRGEPFSLLDVPGDPQFRSRLRIYSLDAPVGEVVVRLVTMSAYPFTEVGRTVVALSPATRDDPAYAEVDLDPLIRAAVQPGPYRVRIDVPPLTLSPSYWAFVSITNNATQHVTIVTPH